MLTPARTAPPAAPDAPGVESEQGGPNPRRWVLVLGLIATLAAVVFPFAPVVQPQVDYRWSAADGAAALPLMPYQPVALTATLDCAAARAAAPGTLLLATVPPHPDPAAEPLPGLRLTAATDGVLVAVDGVDLGRVPLPAGPCTVTVSSDPRATTVRVDDTVVLAKDGDVRPAVVGAFSDLGDGVALAVTADTRFQTTITPVKAAVAVVGVLALLGMLVALHRTDAARGRRLRPRRGWWRPRLVDLAVTALLGFWWIIGAVTVDDGYIAGIIRSRGENGFVGNVYRWLNAPESPFSWFYDLLWPWSQISASTLWMRLPATLLGLLTWGLLSRCALPRLGVHKPWLAALAFATWWVPLCLGLRPEPWVAAGLLGCWLLVERAVATRRLLPLVLGLLLAGATTALTPGGLIAFTPFLAGGRPVLRLLRTRPDLHRWPMVAALVAGPASAVLLMVYDQSFGAMLESTRVRSLVGGGAPWYEEAQRYSELLSDSFQGSIGRRAAVLVTLLAAAAVLMAVRRGPKRRMVVTLLLALAVMTFTPTKWTQHFGDLAGVGAAVLVLGAATARRTVGALAAAVVVGALVVAGLNNWPFVAAWFTPPFSTIPAQVAGIPVATLLLVAGAVAVGLRWRRPVPLLVVVLVFALALQLLGLTRSAIEHRDSYTLASDAVATLRGDPCGLQRTLSVETDPAAGLLPGDHGHRNSRGTASPGPVANRRPPACPSTSGARPCPASSSTGRSPPTGSRCGAIWSSSRPSAPCARATTSSSSSQASTRSTRSRRRTPCPSTSACPSRAGRRPCGSSSTRGPAGRPRSRSPARPASPPWSRCCRRAHGRSWTGRSRSCSPAWCPSRCRRGCRSGGWRRRRPTPRRASPTRPASAGRSRGRGCWSPSSGCRPTSRATRPATPSGSTAGSRSRGCARPNRSSPSTP